MDTLPTATNTPTLPLRPRVAGPIDLVPHWRRADREAAAISEARVSPLARLAIRIHAGHLVLVGAVAFLALVTAGACGWRP